MIAKGKGIMVAALLVAALSVSAPAAMAGPIVLQKRQGTAVGGPKKATWLKQLGKALGERLLDGLAGDQCGRVGGLGGGKTGNGPMGGDTGPNGPAGDGDDDDD